VCVQCYAPPRIAPPPPPKGDGRDLARTIEAMAAALTQQNNAMLQQHEAAMQREEAFLEQHGDAADGGCETGC